MTKVYSRSLRRGEQQEEIETLETEMKSLKLLSSLLTMATFASSQPSYSPTSMETYPPTSLPTGIPSAYPSLVPTDIPTFFPSQVPSAPTPGTVLIQAIEFNVSQTLCNVNIDYILQYQNITLPAILEAFGDSMNIPVSAINSLYGEVVICDIDTDRRRLTNSSNDDAPVDDGGNDDIGSGVPGVRFDVEIVVNEEDVADHDYDSAEDAFNGLINNFNNSDFADILIDVTENSTILSDIFLNGTSGDQDASDDFIPTQVYYTYTAEPSTAPTYQPTPFLTNVPSQPTPSPTDAPSRQPTKLPTPPPSNTITTNNGSDKDDPDNSLFALFALLALPILAYVVYKARQDQRDDESDDQDQSPTPQVPQARNNV